MRWFQLWRVDINRLWISAALRSHLFYFQVTEVWACRRRGLWADPILCDCSPLLLLLSSYLFHSTLALNASSRWARARFFTFSKGALRTRSDRRGPSVKSEQIQYIKASLYASLLLTNPIILCMLCSLRIFYFTLRELDAALMQPYLLYVNWKHTEGGEPVGGGPARARRKPLKSLFHSGPDPSLPHWWRGKSVKGRRFFTLPLLQEKAQEGRSSLPSHYRETISIQFTSLMQQDNYVSVGVIQMWESLS